MDETVKGAAHPLDDFKCCPKCGSREFVIYDEKAKHCNGCGFYILLQSISSHQFALSLTNGIGCW